MCIVVATLHFEKEMAMTKQGKGIFNRAHSVKQINIDHENKKVTFHSAEGDVISTLDLVEYDVGENGAFKFVGRDEYGELFHANYVPTTT